MGGTGAMPKQRPPFDTIRYEALKAQGLTGRAIAKEMGMPEATLRDNLKMMQKAQASHGLPQEDQGMLAGPQQGDTGTPQASSHWASQGDIGIPQGPPEEYSNIPEGLPMGDLGIPHVESFEVHQGTPEVSH